MDQDGGVGGSGLFDDIHCTPQCGALSDDQGGFFDVLEALSEALVFLKQRGAVKCFFDDFGDITAFEWLCDEVVRTLFDRFDGAFNASVCGHGDHFGVCRDRFDGFEQRQAVHLGHHDIADHDIDRVLANEIKSFASVGGGQNVVSFALKDTAQRFDVSGFVVYDEYGVIVCVLQVDPRDCFDRRFALFL